MKKRLLFLSFVVAQISFGQTLPTPVYKHSFTGTLSSTSFVANSSGISLTTDRHNTPQNAALLSSGHGILRLNIDAHKTALLQEGSVSMWFKFGGTGSSAFGNDKPLFLLSNTNESYSEGVLFALSETGVIKVASYPNGSSSGGSESSNATLGADGNWHHFAITWKFGSGGFLKGYLDGVEAVDVDISHSLSAAYSWVDFTGFGPDSPSSLYGSIDEIQVYTSALTATQVAALENPCSIDYLDIPDANFKTALLNHNPVIDTNGDGEIQCSEASAFTGTLSISNKQIAYLTGIEAFTGITGLNCGLNHLSSLDLSQNIALTTVDCSMNSISIINVSQNSALTDLLCFSNTMTTIDVSQNTGLKKLMCNWNNHLTSINLANGNNSIIEVFNAIDCSNLTCIQVDDAVYSNANWTSSNFTIPVGVSYTESCFQSLGISELGKINSISVYPNPTTGIAYLSEIGNVQVFDTSGRLILEQNNTNSIDLSNQESGVYLVKLKSKNGLGTAKIIKE